MVQQGRIVIFVCVWGGGPRVLGKKKRAWRESHEGPRRPTVEFGLCPDGRNATDDSLWEIREETPFGWYVFSRETFNTMNDTSVLDRQACWGERKK